MSSRYEECQRHVFAHVDVLISRVKRKEINRSAIYNLLCGFVDAPAYDAYDRHKLVYDAMCRADEKLG